MSKCLEVTHFATHCSICHSWGLANFIHGVTHGRQFFFGTPYSLVLSFQTCGRTILLWWSWKETFLLVLKICQESRRSLSTLPITWPFHRRVTCATWKAGDALITVCLISFYARIFCLLFLLISVTPDWLHGRSEVIMVSHVRELIFKVLVWVLELKIFVLLLVLKDWILNPCFSDLRTTLC